ncbi:MAG: hypothetical protein FWB80_02035 [Defluviitaleaceae bacterium]|nr:hypothetical protein [Defluviitaleaceae bacterium]
MDMSIDGQIFEYNGKRAEITLLGEHQLRPRTLSASSLEECLKKIAPGADIVVCDTIDGGVERALAAAEESDIICALGSLSMIGKIRDVCYN